MYFNADKIYECINKINRSKLIWRCGISESSYGYRLVIEWERVKVNWAKTTESILPLLKILQEDTDNENGPGTLDCSDYDLYLNRDGVPQLIPANHLIEMFQALPPQINKVILNVKDIESYSDAELMELGKSLKYVQEIKLKRPINTLWGIPDGRVNYTIAYMGSRVPEVQIKDELITYFSPDLADIILAFSRPLEIIDPDTVFRRPSPNAEISIFWENRIKAKKYVKEKMQPMPEVVVKLTEQPIPAVQAPKACHSFELNCLCALALISISALIVGIIAISTASGIPLIIAGSMGLAGAIGYGIFNRKGIIELISENKPALKP